MGHTRHVHSLHAQSSRGKLFTTSVPYAVLQYGIDIDSTITVHYCTYSTHGLFAACLDDVTKTSYNNVVLSGTQTTRLVVQAVRVIQ